MRIEDPRLSLAFDAALVVAALVGALLHPALFVKIALALFAVAGAAAGLVVWRAVHRKQEVLRYEEYRRHLAPSE